MILPFASLNWDDLRNQDWWMAFLAIFAVSFVAIGHLTCGLALLEVDGGVLMAFPPGTGRGR